MMFAFIIVPSSTDEFISPPKDTPATNVVIAEVPKGKAPVTGGVTKAEVPVQADGLEEIIVTDSRRVRDATEASAPIIAPLEAEIAATPPSPKGGQGGITSVDKYNKNRNTAD